MTRVILSGGLGNQLFQYALGRHLSIRNGEKLILDASLYGRAYKARLTSLLQFNLTATIPDPPLSMFVRKLIGRQLWELFPRHTYFQEGYGFDKSVLETPGVRTIVGFFQSEKYFDAVSDTIRRELTFGRMPATDESARMMDEISNSEAVSVHVRRGDYLASSTFSVCTKDYYDTAIDFIRARLRDPRFYFFSDDIDWCRETFRRSGYVFCDLEQSRAEPVNDLRLMSMCKHNIIANSTFSWWGAWLNCHPERTVICPFVWFNNQADFLIDDIIPSTWKKIVF